MPTPLRTVEETEGITAEVKQMLENYAISLEQEAKGFNSQLFTVPKKDGGKDLSSTLNSLVTPEHFKLEGLHMLRDMLRDILRQGN